MNIRILKKKIKEQEIATILVKFAYEIEPISVQYGERTCEFEKITEDGLNWAIRIPLSIRRFSNRRILKFTGKFVNEVKHGSFAFLELYDQELSMIKTERTSMRLFGNRFEFISDFLSSGQWKQLSKNYSRAIEIGPQGIASTSFVVRQVRAIQGKYTEHLKGLVQGDNYEVPRISYLSWAPMNPIQNVDLTENPGPDFYVNADIMDVSVGTSDTVVPMEFGIGGMDIDFAGIEKAEEGGGEVTLFFGTNRKPTGESKPNDFFGSEVNSKLLLGNCKISMPKRHKTGHLERPGTILWFWTLNEKKGKHVVLENIELYEEGKFQEWMNASLSKATSKSVLVFVHGFNTEFDEAARRAAQLSFDLPFEGVPGFFSWPSGGGIFDYEYDQTTAERSIPLFIDFLELISSQTRADRIHIIAHSMGNQLLTKALKEISNKNEYQGILNKLGHVVLAAPDLDQDIFREQILPSFSKVGLSRTLYAHDADSALKFSSTIRSGLKRLGQGGDSIFIGEGIDSVDVLVTDRDTDSHSYVFEAYEMLNDAYQLFKHSFLPNDRRLEKVVKKDGYFWKFRN